jgi:uncharacterized protein YodC (DUF2158 family)
MAYEVRMRIAKEPVPERTPPEEPLSKKAPPPLPPEESVWKHFSEGQIVRRRNGGPLMILGSIYNVDFGTSGTIKRRAWCRWFYNGQRHKEAFYLEELEPFTLGTLPLMAKMGL